MTETWFRNPHNYVRELAEVGGPYRIVWDRGILIKRRIDPVQHAKIYFGENADVEILAVGSQGAAHLDLEHTMENPKGVYPVFDCDEDFKILEEMVSSPIGEDEEACNMPLPPDERPILGQDHRVVITNLPNAHATTSRPYYRALRELQEEYPECKILLHGSYSWRIMLGFGFYAADYEPRSSAAKGAVDLPTGKRVAYARTIGQQQWVNLLGTSVIELKEPRNRCLFNIRSWLWAGEHFNENIKFATRGKVEVDPDSPKTVIPTTAISRTKHTFKAAEGDKITCDTCSLADSCKLYRVGAVCSLQGSETSPLAKIFQSRDSSRIIDGLGTILSAQTQRLERGMESEEEFGELDPEVTKMMNSLFNNGVKLAKLIDPTLTKPLVQINGSAHQVAQSNPKELGAAVVRALEDQGIKRENITPEMFERMLLQMTGGPQPESEPAIEGQIVNGA